MSGALQWVAADSVLQEYRWKATFCVARFDTISADNVRKLSALQASGHEIAAHGYSHLNAVEYVQDKSMEAYFDVDIFPLLDSMQAKGFQVRSFAYPFGARKSAIDQQLLKRFDVVRGTTYGKREAKNHRCFSNGTTVVWGLGMDSHYGNDIDYVVELLEYAKWNGKFLILYGHMPRELDMEQYVTSYTKLKQICQFINENGMHFVTLNEVKDKR